jgi:transposase InsO family protein
MAKRPLVPNLEDAARITKDWRKDYNKLRPYSSIGNRTPSQD